MSATLKPSQALVAASQELPTRITVADMVLMHRRLGRALEEISGTYDLPLAAAYAAMAYYYDHRDEIDHSLDEAFKKKIPHSCEKN